ncbi:MAG: PHP domain-containing protein [Candidatus Omnitrophica bacterium]|nr:PHP domain-containing protein [Candidatus Omnitrophota bacterium]MDD3987387.1 PHP domain-containing protein [Candidatus Omnitrophota bacterium]MDD4981339.1 PHP domain-containing protein [Candidatus Omnitrophota bacterium]MDD5664626.1 PHP domain-containing protein [Candidatus Omnitrophota bacterium]
MKFADLHLHTNYSDGTYTPEELVEKAVGAKLSCISITDHDTVGAIPEAMAAANASGIEILPGIEISCEYELREVHILGYLIDYKSSELLKRLETLKENRISRIYKITEKLNALGIGLKAEDVFSVANGATVGRLHVARAMVLKGLVKTVSEAFNRYIGDSGPAFSLGFRFTPEEAIKFIHDNAGVAVLAHPYIIKDEELIFKLIGLGLMGLEVYYPEHSQGEINFYLGLAKEYNLLVTGGSDCHGSAKPQVRIGSIKIPYDLVEKMKEVRGRLS